MEEKIPAQWKNLQKLIFVYTENNKKVGVTWKGESPQGGSLKGLK